MNTLEQVAFDRLASAVATWAPNSDVDWAVFIHPATRSIGVFIARPDGLGQQLAVDPKASPYAAIMALDRDVMEFLAMPLPADLRPLCPDCAAAASPDLLDAEAAFLEALRTIDEEAT